jgi:tripartite-type tricarboxylate transporter receptor subunit TctC
VEKPNGRSTASLLLGLMTFFIPAILWSQDYPTKPINIVVANAPGGTADVTLRVLAAKAEKFLGQPFILSNNGSSAGTVAFGIAAKEKPDGYHLAGGATTLMMTWLPLTRSVSYKPEDFIPIMHYGGPTSGLVALSDAPYKTLKEFIEYTRRNPGKVNYGCAGAGIPPHVIMEFLAKQESISWTAVPYPGGLAALTAVLGGHLNAYSGGQDWVPHVKEGRVRLLSVYSEKRMRIFPDVPTIRELGYDFSDDPYYTVYAPKGTPSHIIKKLDGAFRKAMEDPEFIQTMERLQVQIAYRHSEELIQFIEKTRETNKKRLAEINIELAPSKK